MNLLIDFEREIATLIVDEQEVFTTTIVIDLDETEHGQALVPVSWEGYTDDEYAAQVFRTLGAGGGATRYVVAESVIDGSYADLDEWAKEALLVYLVGDAK